MFEDAKMVIRSRKGTAKDKKVQPKKKRYNQRQKGTANGKKVQPKTKRYSRRQKGTAKDKKVQPKTKRYNQRQERYSQRQKGTAKDKKVQPKTKRYSQRQRKTMVYKTSYRNFLIRIIEHSISYISSISNLCSNLLNTNKIYFHNKTRFRKHHIYNMQ